MSVPPVLERLRDDTRHLHARVEERVDLLHRGATLAGYEHLLGQMLGLYVPLEAKLARLPWAGTGVSFDERRKCGLIRADLVALDATGEAPTYEGVPELRSLAAGFGCLYVLEGATLGGQIILRHIGQSLGLDASRGASFFASYGPRVGPMWRAFGEAASAHCATEARIEEAVAAATHTFEAFHHWIKPPRDEPSPVQEAL